MIIVSILIVVVVILSSSVDGNRLPPFSVATTRTGTTIVGVCCSDGVVLGADTRTTRSGMVVGKDKVKIRKLAKRIYACAAGTSADCEQICLHVARKLAYDRVDSNILFGDSSTTFCENVKTAVGAMYDRMMPDQNGRGTAECDAIIGGMDNEHGPSLYQISSAGSPSRQAFVSLGSGCTDATAILETLLGNATMYGHSMNSMVNLSVEEVVRVVIEAVSAGIENDLGSGSDINLCVICRDGVKKWRHCVMSYDPEPVVQSRTVHQSLVPPNPQDQYPQQQQLLLLLDGIDHSKANNIENKCASVLGRRIFTARKSRTIPPSARRVGLRLSTVEYQPVQDLEEDLMLNMEEI